MIRFIAIEQTERKIDSEIFVTRFSEFTGAPLDKSFRSVQCLQHSLKRDQYAQEIYFGWSAQFTFTRLN